MPTLGGPERAGGEHRVLWWHHPQAAGQGGTAPPSALQVRPALNEKSIITSKQTNKSTFQVVENTLCGQRVWEGAGHLSSSDLAFQNLQRVMKEKFAESVFLVPEKLGGAMCLQVGTAFHSTGEINLCTGEIIFHFSFSVQ